MYIHHHHLLIIARKGRTRRNSPRPDSDSTSTTPLTHSRLHPDCQEQVRSDRQTQAEKSSLTEGEEEDSVHIDPRKRG